MFEQFARTVSKYTGKAWAFALAFGTCLVWAATGPVFHFSDTWQLRASGLLLGVFYRHPDRLEDQRPTHPHRAMSDLARLIILAVTGRL